MAEKRLIKGLFKDTSHIDQPEGSWRYAKNAIFNDKKGSVSNEGGTSLAGHLGLNPTTGAQNDKVIGAIEVNDDKVVLFVTDVVNTTNPRSEVGIWENGVYTVLLNPNVTLNPEHDLNFKEEYPIEGTFKIDAQGNLIVYWTDDLNPPRALNVTRQKTSATNLVYGIPVGQLHSIDLLNLFPYGGPVPHIDLEHVTNVLFDANGIPHQIKPLNHQNSIIEGGGLLTAVYYLALAYVDKDFVATNYLTVSNPVSIVEEFDNTYPHVKKDGAKHGTQTTKAIKWIAKNLNTNYEFLRPVVIRKMGDATEAFKLNDLELLPGTLSKEIIFSGIEGVATASVNDVIIDTISYEKAKTINQLDGVLYLGNVEGRQDLGYQKYANNIKLYGRLKVWQDFDPFVASVDHFETGFGSRAVDTIGGVTPPNVKSIDNYRYQPNIYQYKGYMRDEIYAFYIAFILKDGSMSYAYHIPGREAVYGQTTGGVSDELEPINNLPIPDWGGLWSDFHELSPNYSRRFHFIDSWVIDGQPGGGLPVATYRSMNFWHNSTEFYPNTDDFQVWDRNGILTGTASDGVTPASSIKGLNVRHHHFPSNRNMYMKSIGVPGDNGFVPGNQQNSCFTANSEGVQYTTDTYTDVVFTAYKYDGNQSASVPSDGSWATMRFPDTSSSVVGVPNGFNAVNLAGTANYVADTPTSIAAANALWNGTHFTANQPMTVEVSWAVEFKESGGSKGEVETQLRKIINGVNTLVNKDTIAGNNFGCGAGCTRNDYNSHGSGPSQSPVSGWSTTVTMDTGDRLYVRSKRGKTNGSLWQSENWNICCYNHPGTNSMYINFKVNSLATAVPLADQNDAYIGHRVNILGFDLEDVQIPQSIADKVQGFRIYYAKRNHADRTILGQSPLTPGTFHNDQIGICAEAVTTEHGSQVLSTLQTIAEPFWNIDVHGQFHWRYTPAAQNPYFATIGPGSPSLFTGTGTEEYTQELFSFHDFYLLRTKNSLSSATHFTLEYKVQNFAWNGSGLDQDKKMVTKLTTASNPDDPLTLKEVWGWDTTQNCYAQKMKTSIFIGAIYESMGGKTQPRMLGQKSKTYLLGDSIFKGEALGFGGKLFNDFGESCIVFRAMHGHGISAYTFRSYAASTSYSIFNAPFVHPNPEFGVVGRPHYGPATLTNTMSTAGTWDDPGFQHKHKTAIANLKAFKTDVYKSIDSQELVWTGFQIVGDDLNNFVFNDAGMPIDYEFNGANQSGDFTTLTVQSNPDSILYESIENDRGIYGGDTYICRYGIPKALTYSQAGKDSNPNRSVDFQIVESTDNINFRHEESDESRYFPNSPARPILQHIGNQDFNHFDNMKYNENYSELNDIRPAFPLPLREIDQIDFPTRTHRSAKNDTTSIIDNYRLFLANQFKDLPRNRGDLWKLSTFNNLIYFHMEKSLFAAKGKQQMQMKDGSEAFVGSGDIFQQDPDEIIQTKDGFAGTQSQFSAVTTRYGYFFVDQASKKVFLMKNELAEISNLGMESWFRDNLAFYFEGKFEFNVACVPDNPIESLGFHTIYDPKYKRIILTKRDVKPTAAFEQNWISTTAITSPVPDGQIIFNSVECKFQEWVETDPVLFTGRWEIIEWDNTTYFERAGWTISYYPELGVWASFHDYIPYIYFNTSTDFYSLTDKYERPVYSAGVTTFADHKGTTFGNAGIWKHNSTSPGRGILYQENTKSSLSDADWKSKVFYYLFEIEVIHNETKSVDSLISNFSYTLETFNTSNISVLEHGFTHFIIYNTMQISGVGFYWQNLGRTAAQQDSSGVFFTSANANTLEYLINTRRVGNNWKVNSFRDMAVLATNTNPYYMSTASNIIGGLNTGTITSSSTNNMFAVEGMNEIVNGSYIDLAKNWDKKRKFIDKWVGIRLIYDNITNNLLNLYSTDVGARQISR